MEVTKYLNLTLLFTMLFTILFTIFFSDDIPVDERYVRISLELFVLYTIVSVIGVVFACVCLWFNLWYKNHK